jgi:hypothetical protein
MTVMRVLSLLAVCACCSYGNSISISTSCYAGDFPGYEGTGSTVKSPGYCEAIGGAPVYGLQPYGESAYAYAQAAANVTFDSLRAIDFYFSIEVEALEGINFIFTPGIIDPEKSVIPADAAAQVGIIVDLTTPGPVRQGFFSFCLLGDASDPWYYPSAEGIDLTGLAGCTGALYPVTLGLPMSIEIDVFYGLVADDYPQGTFSSTVLGSGTFALYELNGQPVEGPEPSSFVMTALFLALVLHHCFHPRVHHRQRG